MLWQKGLDGLWHPCAYLSKTFLETEWNYQIYDWELVAIVQALEAWRHYIEGIKYPTQVLSDHKNFTYFQTAQKLNRQQARWSLYLSQFNIQLVHQPGKTLTQADALSQRVDHNLGDHDNEEVTLLSDSLFAHAVHTELQEKIRDTTSCDKRIMGSTTNAWHLKKRPTIESKEDWSMDDGIVLYKERVYVPSDNDLQQEVVRNHHERAIMRHPDTQKTFELVFWEYWWPEMCNFITQYVKECATCQTAKVNTHPTKASLLPITHSGNLRSFGTITMDYVTGLPTSNRYDTIQIVGNHDVSKAIVLTLCTKETSAMYMAQMLERDVYQWFSLPDQTISDSWISSRKSLGRLACLTTLQPMANQNERYKKWKLPHGFIVGTIQTHGAHYSHNSNLLIIIALTRWQESPHSSF